MNTLSLRVLANSDEEFSKMMRHELRAAADCIDKLRARCRNQRKELKRLNASNERIQNGRNSRRLDDYLRLQAYSIERIARFVGCLPAPAPKNQEVTA